jgi:hypothetical protein
MSAFRLDPQGGYSLRESAGFIDAWHEAPSEGGKTERHLHLAFLTDGEWRPAGVCLGGGMPAADADGRRRHDALARRRLTYGAGIPR